MKIDYWIALRHIALNNLTSVKEWEKEIKHLQTLVSNLHVDSAMRKIYSEHIQLYRKKIQIAKS